MRVLCTVGVLTVFLTVSRARSEERRFTDSPQTETSELLIGAKITYVDDHAEDRRTQGIGLAVFVEFTLIEDLVELELGVGGVRPEDGAAQLAFEPLIKTTFRASTRVDPYVGLGPTIVWSKESPHFRAGGQLVLGSYLWLHDALGFDVDVGCSMFSVERALAYEFTLGAGPVLRL